MKKLLVQTALSLILILLAAFAASPNAVALTDGGEITFTDDSEISYKEAVHVISAINVVNGYSDGSFHPKGYLTRGAAAKIIVRLCNSNDSSTYVARTCGVDSYRAYYLDGDPKFDDALPFGTFTSYIYYCVDYGLIDGYSVDQFYTRDPITIYEFLRILLRALGYDPDNIRYFDDGIGNWRTMVREDALSAHLLDGLREPFDSMTYLTREEAALLMLNTLQADMIAAVSDLDNPTSRTSMPRTIFSDAPDQKNRYCRIDDRKTDDGSQIVQFGELYFKKLKRSEGGGNVVWTLDSDGDASRFYRSDTDENGNIDRRMGPYPLTNSACVVTFRTYNGTLSHELVYANESYGDLPEPSDRTNRLFEGWYTSPVGGEEVTAQTLAPDQTKEQILYAHWSLDAASDYVVTFDANGGGNPEFSEKIVTSGAYYSFLPQVKRERHRFDGWYTSPVDGDKITADTVANLTENQTLYAHWTRAYQVSFYVSDAVTGNPDRFAIKQVYQGEPYGVLPVVQRDYFTGWFTSDEPENQTDETAVTASTIVTLAADQNLYAGGNAANTFTLILNANGGILPRYGTGRYTIPFANINTARLRSFDLNEYAAERAGYVFDGWFTRAVDGEPVRLSSDRGFRTVKDDVRSLTLYAHWTSEAELDAELEAESDIFSKFTYAFSNDDVNRKNSELYAADPLRWDYIYSFMFESDSQLHEDTLRRDGDYSAISNARWEIIMSNVHSLENALKNNGGRCYGMAATSALFYDPASFLDSTRAKISIRDFNESAERLHDLKLGSSTLKWGTVSPDSDNPNTGLSLNEFIEVMHISQFSIYFCKADWEYTNNFNDLYNRTLMFQENPDSTRPVIICIYKSRKEGEITYNQGHALLGYRIERKSDTEDWMYVYDCNYPDDRGCYIVIEKDLDGSCKAWSYNTGDQNTSYDSRNEDTRISFIPSEIYYDLGWENRGRPDRDDEDRSNQDSDFSSDSYALIYTSASNATIYDSFGNLVARFRNGSMVQKNEHMTVYPVAPLLDNGEGHSTGVAVYIPVEGEYALFHEDGQNFHTFAAANLTDGMTVQNTASQSVIFSVQDGKRMRLEMEAPGRDYKLDVMTAARMEYQGNADSNETPQKDDACLRLDFDGADMTITGSSYGSITVNNTHYDSGAHLFSTDLSQTFS